MITWLSEVFGAARWLGGRMLDDLADCCVPATALAWGRLHRPPDAWVEWLVRNPAWRAQVIPEVDRLAAELREAEATP